VCADVTEDSEDIVRRIRTGELWILITTDLMARGMDFKTVRLVVNYDFPQVRSSPPAGHSACRRDECAGVVLAVQSMVTYVHRIGRTGRAGRTGEAVTLYTEEDIVSPVHVW
jgi:ATP-dependent RNA helicase DDX52/ROK1